ncbi:MAG TPA: hypothetical protein DC054_20315 [Blastocatellia bacterium]|nr:hypothetical protein [Blastocatellia bacterium]
MSTSNPDPRLNLEIRCADSATEVFVIDGQFNLRDRGIGYLKTLLEPGIYKVKVRAGFETREQPVILRDKDQTIEISRFNFVSPAPLNQTSKTHEFQMDAASDGSRNVDLSDGQGSSIFIFVRDWTSDTPPAQVLPSYPNPGRGLSLRNIQGNVIADLTIQGKQSNQWEPWATCNVELNPGAYLLSLETPSGETLEQIIVASPGWQTQVFLLQRSYGEGPDSQRADLQGAAILMARQGQGFDPNNDTARLAELARLGLSNARRVLSDDVRQMLAHKFDNPMLGILAAHLLLLDKEPELGLLSIVIDNLRMLLPGSHPDVDALSLVLNPGAAHTFGVPPMLRKSWTLVVNATSKRPDIVPDQSLAAKIATHLWSSDPWLVWMKPKEIAPSDMESEQALGFESIPPPKLATNLEVALRARLHKPWEQSRVTSETSRGDSPFAAISKMTAARIKDDQPSSSLGLAPGLEAAERPNFARLGEEGIDKLVQSMNIPRKNLEGMIARLNTNPLDLDEI